MKQTNTEEELVKDYVLHKSLNRPKTNVVHLLIVLIAYVMGCFFLSKGVIFILETQKQALIFFLVYFLGLISFGKIIAIIVVKCYQRYAPEKMRRICRCKPTCSEYAIEVLKKRNFFVAIYKICKRVFYTCNGKYKVDLP